MDSINGISKLAQVKESNYWRFPKISYGFSQDAELKRNSEGDKVEKDFLRDKT